MPSRKNLVDHTYGRLRVKFFVGVVNGKSQWGCYCDPELEGCGDFTIVPIDNLVSGAISSCGCLAKELLIERNKARKLV